MSVTAKDIAEGCAEGAIENFKKVGGLAPVMIFESEPHVIVALSREAGADIQTAIGALALAVGATMDENPSFITVIFEGWLKIVKKTDLFERGDLEKMHEAGDTDVHTGIFITTYNTAIPTASHCITYDVDNNMSREDWPGVQQGGAAEHMHRAFEIWDEARGHKPEGTTLEEVLEGLSVLIEMAMIEKDEHGNPG